ncbi:MAG: SDR family NAD(P)-dependent oxidoreductase [Deltaproteobacteria bacterium]|nr:MAG: SDR family NAD(P)-dependent oxidoreductase [Deltaproteobacteria bacterium]
MTSLNFFTGKSVMITGAASGLGRELARQLSPYAERLILLDLNQDGLSETADICRAKGSYIATYKADLLSDNPLAEVIEKEECPDVIVANAGVGGVNPARFFDEGIDARIMGINYFGVVKTVSPYLKKMCERGSGHIVGISSLASIRGLPGACSYSASKAALNNFLESLRLDVAPYGVKVITVLPGFLETPMANHNEFEMPFKVTVERSAQHVLKAIIKNKKRYAFPWIMGFLSLFNKFMPVFIYDKILPLVSGQDKDMKPKIF